MLANVSDPFFVYKNDDLICILQYMLSGKYFENVQIFLIFLDGSSFLTIRKFPKKFHSNRTRNQKVSFGGGWGGK